MNKKSFETIILNLQLAHKKSRELYKLGVDLMEYDESYEFVIDELFKASFNEVQRGWIDWFLYERESPTGKILKAHKKVGRKKVEICHTIDSLWETVNEAGQDQAFNDRVGG
jgi:fatty acid/phospholipid biosynthesis enzyme